MSAKDELKQCYIERKGSVQEVIEKYSGKLLGEKERGLFMAAMRLLSAYCAAPGVSSNLKLDTLAKEGGSCQILKRLIREYGKGVEEIIDVYDCYFRLDKPADFWEFFNEKLELPDDWYNKNR